MLVRKKVVIRTKEGLHVRPAALFVRLANKFDSDITLQKGNEKINGKSITGVLMLGCEKGSAVTVTAKGRDAERAVQELVQLLQKGIPGSIKS